MVNWSVEVQWSIL